MESCRSSFDLRFGFRCYRVDIMQNRLNKVMNGHYQVFKYRPNIQGWFMLRQNHHQQLMIYCQRSRKYYISFQLFAGKITKRKHGDIEIDYNR